MNRLSGLIIMAFLLNSYCALADVWKIEVCLGEVCGPADWSEYPGKFLSRTSCMQAARSKGFGQSSQYRCHQQGEGSEKQASTEAAQKTLVWKIMVCPGEVCEINDWSEYPGKYASESSCLKAVRSKGFGSIRVKCIAD